MKHLTLLLIAFFFHAFSFGQPQKVKGSINTTDTATLVILNVYPDSFPNVAVVFKAETSKGEPVWNLTKEKMRAKEDSKDCDIISLEQISKNKPLNLGVVIDHSGSMMGNSFVGTGEAGNKYYYINGVLTTTLPPGYKFHSPIEDAKAAVKKFVQTFNAKKDFISIIGFSERVDTIVPLTQNITLVNRVVDSMTATNSTALYDAMITGLDEIKKSNGVQVLVTLTDGMDNASKATYKDVIEHAKKLDVPVYIIGLGMVNKDTLQLIASSTNGQFYYTETSESLENIYAKISKQVQAFYNLVYTSSNFSSTDSSRQIALSFDVDSIYLQTAPYKKDFPTEVVAYIAKKEKQKAFMLFGGIALVVLVGAGTLLYYRRKKKNTNTQPVINKVFPNPSNGIINIDFISNNGQLHIINLYGTTIKTINLQSTDKQFNLTAIPKGNYIAQIQAGNQQSNAVQFILQ